MRKDGGMVIQVFMFQISYQLIALENSIIHVNGKHYQRHGLDTIANNKEEGDSSNTFKRIVNFDLDGWLATTGGPLEYLDRSIKDLRGYAEKAKKDPNKFEIITLTFPQIMDSNKPNT
jgi:hypothetical protein